MVASFLFFTPILETPAWVLYPVKGGDEGRKHTRNFVNNLPRSARKPSRLFSSLSRSTYHQVRVCFLSSQHCVHPLGSVSACRSILLSTTSHTSFCARPNHSSVTLWFTLGPSSASPPSPGPSWKEAKRFCTFRCVRIGYRSTADGRTIP